MDSSASDSRKEIACTTNFSKLSKKHKKIISIILVNILLHICFITFLKCKNSEESRTQSMLMSSKQLWFSCSCSYTKGAVGRVTFTSVKHVLKYTKASKLAYLVPPGQFLMGAKLFIGSPKVQNKVVLKINWYGPCENAWFPWQPII